MCIYQVKTADFAFSFQSVLCVLFFGRRTLEHTNMRYENWEQTNYIKGKKKRLVEICNRHIDKTLKYKKKSVAYFVLHMPTTYTQMANTYYVLALGKIEWHILSPFDQWNVLRFTKTLYDSPLFFARIHICYFTSFFFCLSNLIGALYIFNSNSFCNIVSTMAGTKTREEQRTFNESICICLV